MTQIYNDSIARYDDCKKCIMSRVVSGEEELTEPEGIERKVESYGTDCVGASRNILKEPILLSQI